MSSGGASAAQDVSLLCEPTPRGGPTFGGTHGAAAGFLNEADMCMLVLAEPPTGGYNLRRSVLRTQGRQAGQKLLPRR